MTTEILSTKLPLIFITFSVHSWLESFKARTGAGLPASKMARVIKNIMNSRLIHRLYIV
jgi:hypothetical protein